MHTLQCTLHTSQCILHTEHLTVNTTHFTVYTLHIMYNPMFARMKEHEELVGGDYIMHNILRPGERRTGGAGVGGQCSLVDRLYCGQDRLSCGQDSQGL